MDFSHRKLPRDAESSLKSVPIESVRPFSLMIAPVYAYMTLNEKYVAVKAPLDFFTSEELERLKPFKSFYVPGFVEQAEPFRAAAREIRKVLSLTGSDGASGLPPTPYELSDAAIRALGPLWRRFAEPDPLALEPFFATIFADALCDGIVPEKLRAARDASIADYECAIFRSSYVVVLGLLLGYGDLGFLSQLRARGFDLSIAGSTFEGASESDELLRLVFQWIKDNGARSITSDVFANRRERVAQKLLFRFERIRRELSPVSSQMPTIFGPRGFADG